MLIDNKGRLFGKVSIIDLLIVVIVVAAVAGIGYKYAKSQAVGPTQSFIMVFQEDDRPEFAVSSIKEGDIVKDKLSGIVIGTITKVELGPSKGYGNDSEGRWVVSEKPGYFSYKISVKVSGVLTSNGVTIGGTEFYINKQDQTRFGMSNLYPRIMDIQPVKE